ncbi:MAG: DNA alkylation repair protein [bacterium]
MAEPFKHRIDRRAVERIAAAITLTAFDRAAFIADADRLDALELKARVTHIADALARHLPPFPDALPALLGALGDPVPTEAPDADADDSGLRGFIAWPILRYVARHGLDHPAAALPALGEMTSRFSAEFAVRPYLVRHPDAAWEAVRGWAASDDPHRRRLASEGTRPRLPWGERLTASIADPRRGLAVIEALRDDPEEYVRRSVANHLNDVSKDHPERVLEIAARWKIDASPARERLVRHALRTLVKAADARALALVDCPPADVQVEGLRGAAAVRIGEKLPFTLTLCNREDRPAKVRVDYLMHHVKANGSRRPKAFHLVDTTLAPGERRALGRSHDFRVVTTRRLHPGVHRVEVRVNGAVGDGFDFTLMP